MYQRRTKKTTKKRIDRRMQRAKSNEETGANRTPRILSHQLRTRPIPTRSNSPQQCPSESPGTMALLSRPSLRSVRRPDSPPKPLRDRRKSSPDCLDTTAEPRVSPLKSRRARGVSSSSINTPVSGPVAGQNGASRARRETATPSADLLRGVHESPDPLDTISPALKQRVFTPTIADEIEPPESPVTRPRRNDRLRADGASATDRKDDAEQTGEKSTGRRSLRSTDTGSRCKSELAQYFHNYEQIISLEDPEPGEFFGPDMSQPNGTSNATQNSSRQKPHSQSLTTSPNRFQFHRRTQPPLATPCSIPMAVRGSHSQLLLQIPPL